MLELPRIEIRGHVLFFFPEYRVNTRSTSERNAPPAVPDPRNPGPESELSRVCPDPCRDPGSLSPCHITVRQQHRAVAALATRDRRSAALAAY
jgi:hypothetical protein